jgi:hypothetical protein
VPHPVERVGAGERPHLGDARRVRGIVGHTAGREDHDPGERAEHDHDDQQLDQGEAVLVRAATSSVHDVIVLHEGPHRIHPPST